MSECFPGSSYDERDCEPMFSGSQVTKLRYSYQDIHTLVKMGAKDFEKLDFVPDYMLAIGGGGFIPARMLRTHLDVPILAFSVSYYAKHAHEPSREPTIVQSVDLELLRGKNILIVDEVDDTRTTLAWVLKKLQTELERTGDTESAPTRFAVLVVHNKQKPKNGTLDPDVPYVACESTPGDVWIEYPWDVE